MLIKIFEHRNNILVIREFCHSVTGTADQEKKKYTHIIFNQKNAADRRIQIFTEKNGKGVNDIRIDKGQLTFCQYFIMVCKMECHLTRIYILHTDKFIIMKRSFGKTGMDDKTQIFIRIWKRQSLPQVIIIRI